MRTVTAGLLAGGGLMMLMPHATASAEEKITPGEATGNRPDFPNPAPLVRAAQAVGDNAFNPDNGPINTALNNSPIGGAYHQAFGYAEVTEDDDDNPDTPDIIVTPGSNGYIKGPLNTAPISNIYTSVRAQGVPLPRECNLKRSADTLTPTFPGACM
jgi:hypothetical protein